MTNRSAPAYLIFCLSQCNDARLHTATATDKSETTPKSAKENGTPFQQIQIEYPSRISKETPLKLHNLKERSPRKEPRFPEISQQTIARSNTLNNLPASTAVRTCSRTSAGRTRNNSSAAATAVVAAAAAAAAAFAAAVAVHFLHITAPPLPHPAPSPIPDR